jgi:hypothetical protein
MDELPLGLTILLVVAIEFSLRYVVFGRRRAPEPDGLESGEMLISSGVAWAEIDGLEPASKGFAYLTDRRVVWTPRMDSWEVRNLRAGLPYTEPVIFDFLDVKRISTPFELGVSRLRLETNDVVLELKMEGRSFRSWHDHILAHARNLLPADQPVLRSRSRYTSAVFLRATKFRRVFVAALLSLYGLYVGAKLLNLLDTNLSTGQIFVLLISGVMIAGGYVFWSATKYPE